MIHALKAIIGNKSGDTLIEVLVSFLLLTLALGSLSTAMTITNNSRIRAFDKQLTAEIEVGKIYSEMVKGGVVASNISGAATTSISFSYASDTANIPQFEIKDIGYGTWNIEYIDQHNTLCKDSISVYMKD